MPLAARSRPSRWASLVALATAVVSVLVAPGAARANTDFPQRCYVNAALEVGQASGTGVFASATRGGVPSGWVPAGVPYACPPAVYDTGWTLYYGLDRIIVTEAQRATANYGVGVQSYRVYSAYRERRDQAGGVGAVVGTLRWTIAVPWGYVNQTRSVVAGPAGTPATKNGDFNCWPQWARWNTYLFETGVQVRYCQNPITRQIRIDQILGYYGGETSGGSFIADIGDCQNMAVDNAGSIGKVGTSAQIICRMPMTARFNVTTPTPSLEVNFTPATRELRVIFVFRYNQVDVVFQAGTEGGTVRTVPFYPPS